MENLVINEELKAEIVEVKVSISGKEITLKLTSELTPELYERIVELDVEAKSFMRLSREWIMDWFSIETDRKLVEQSFKKMPMKIYKQVYDYAMAFFKAIAEQKKN